jgi:pyruvate/oxaloacetate carboxyltransferase
MVMMTYFRACYAGVDIIDTAFSPLAGGTSQPPIESVVAALKGTPYDPGLDMNLLNEIADYFRELREKSYEPSKLINPKSERIDPSIMIHQIPGGMFSNLLEQLREQNALDRLKEVLEEVPKVRKELGYPPLVTPTSQLVGTQAVFNVLSGKRYSIIPKEVKDYVKGLYGRSPAPISEKMIKKIIGDEKPITCRPADLLKPMLERIPDEAKMYITSEEDKITYALFPKVALEFFKKRKSERKDLGSGVSPERVSELEEVAAISVAVATYLRSLHRVRALIPNRVKETLSPWVLASRQSLAERGA